MSHKYIRYAALKSQFGIPFTRVHLKRLIDAGAFPAPVQLSANTIAWPEDDIVAYGERLRAERDAKQHHLAAPSADGDEAPSAPLIAAGARR